MISNLPFDTTKEELEAFAAQVRCVYGLGMWRVYVGDVESVCVRFSSCFCLGVVIDVTRAPTRTVSFTHPTNQPSIHTTSQTHGAAAHRRARW